MTSAAAFRGKADPECGDGGVLRDAKTTDYYAPERCILWGSMPEMTCRA